MNGTQGFEEGREIVGLGVLSGLAKRTFTVEEYFGMGAAGIIGEDERVELIDGEIVEMAAAGPLHAACVKRLAEILFAYSLRVGEAEGEAEAVGRYLVGVQDPVVIGDDGAPEPDLALLRRAEDFYAAHPPTAADVFLLIEVSGTSLLYDREIKLSRYARAGVPEVWIVDLVGREISVYADPRPEEGRYATRKTYRAGRRVRSETLEGLEPTMEDVLGDG